jgi:hypothetical protein
MLVVVFGSLTALMIAFPGSRLKGLPKVLRNAFFTTPREPEQIMALMHQTLASSLKEAHAENGKMSGVIERGLANYEDYFQSLLPPPKDVQPHAWSKAGLEASIAEQVESYNKQFQDMYEVVKSEYCDDYGPIAEGVIMPAMFTGGRTILEIETGYCELYFKDVPGSTKKVGAQVGCSMPKVIYTKEFPRFTCKHKTPTVFPFKECRTFSAEFGGGKEIFLAEPGEEFVVPLYQLPQGLQGFTGGFLGMGKS